MTSGDLLDLFRDEMADKVTPYLWSDDLVFGYIDDACKRFCRLTDGIPDSTTATVVNLAIVAGTDTYPLSPLVLKIRTARRADNGREVLVLNEEDMAPQDRFFDNLPGIPTALITGMDVDSVRVHPYPSVATPMKLSVFRLPLVDVTDDQPLEVPAQHQRALLLRAKALAYGKQDAETFDRTKFETFDDKFTIYCAAAKAEQARARHKPRTVAYGGI